MALCPDPMEPLPGPIRLGDAEVAHAGRRWAPGPKVQFVFACLSDAEVVDILSYALFIGVPAPGPSEKRVAARGAHLWPLSKAFCFCEKGRTACHGAWGGLQKI